MSYFRDSDFQEKMLVPFCRDRNFLKKMSGILSAEDFKPRKNEGMIEAYWIAQLAATYWKKYREPIGGMLRTEVLDYVRSNKRKMSSKARDHLMDLVDKIKKSDIVAIEAIETKVIEYKERQQKSSAVKELIEKQEKGELSTREFLKICRKAVEKHSYTFRVSDFTHKDSVDKRIERREKNRDRKFPHLMIEEFDRVVRTFPRGNFGIVLAKYKVGKSTAAVHLGQAYALQGYKVLHFTLEDELDLVEDRYDASFAGIKMKELDRKSSKLRRRMKRELEKIRGKIKIVDGTDGGFTMQRMEEIWENFRNQGFDADVIIVDYDEGVVPSEHYKGDGGERRQMVDLYHDFKNWMSKRQLYGWIMAQTQRGKSGQRKMIVTGDDSAMDISKIKRCALGVGIGDGKEELGEDARYWFTFVHRYDKGRWGFNIVGDYKRAIFYDAEKTRDAREEEHRHHHRH